MSSPFCSLDNCNRAGCESVGKISSDFGSASASGRLCIRTMGSLLRYEVGSGRCASCPKAGSEARGGDGSRIGTGSCGDPGLHNGRAEVGVEMLGSRLVVEVVISIFSWAGKLKLGLIIPLGRDWGSVVELRRDAVWNDGRPDSRDKS